MCASIEDLGSMAGAAKERGRLMEHPVSDLEANGEQFPHIPRLVDITTIAAHLDVPVRDLRRLAAEDASPT